MVCLPSGYVKPVDPLTPARELAAEVMAIEAAGDAKRAEALFARYGATTPAITKPLQPIDALPVVKVRTVFVSAAKMPG